MLEDAPEPASPRPRHPVLTGSRRGGTRTTGLHDAGRAPLRPGAGFFPIRVGGQRPAPADLQKGVGGRVVEDYEWWSLIFTNSRRGRVVEDSVRDFQHDPGKQGGLPEPKSSKRVVVENKSSPMKQNLQKGRPGGF